jgi:hypothetical protein
MSWIRRLFGRRHVCDDIAQEIEQHLEEKAEQLISDGVPADQAFQRARREFGNVTLLTERSREVWGGQFREAVWSDFRYALRQLRKSPAFALSVILTLVVASGDSGRITERAILAPTLRGGYGHRR